jgi:hypothetical protein
MSKKKKKPQRMTPATYSRVKHSRTDTPLHAAHSAYMKGISDKNRENEVTITLKIAQKTPVAEMKDRLFYDRAKHLPVLFTGQTAQVVTGAQMEEFLNEEIRERDTKKIKKGWDYRAVKNGGEKKQRYENKEIPDGERLMLHVVTLPAWSTELLSVHAEDDDLAELTEKIGAKFELLTGCKVLCSNLHGDTDNYHFDIFCAEYERTDQGGLEYDYHVGAIAAGKGTEILIRKHEDGFKNLNQNDLIEATARLAKEADPAWRAIPANKKGKFHCFYDLDIGRFADEWVKTFAKNKGLTEELKKRMDRFDDFEGKLDGYKKRAQKLIAEGPKYIKDLEFKLSKANNENNLLKKLSDSQSTEIAAYKKKLAAIVHHELEPKQLSQITRLPSVQSTVPQEWQQSPNIQKHEVRSR